MLKSNILTLFLSTFIIFSCGKMISQEAIYGVWKGELQEKELLFQFKSDKTCVLSFRDKVSGSIEIVNGNFEMDFSKKPIPLTIRSIPQLNHPLHTIVEFNGTDTIQLANFAPRWRLRPISFDRNTSMRLKRNAVNK